MQGDRVMGWKHDVDLVRMDDLIQLRNEIVSLYIRQTTDVITKYIAPMVIPARSPPYLNVDATRQGIVQFNGIFRAAGEY
jgi:hypothetical protein